MQGNKVESVDDKESFNTGEERKCLTICVFLVDRGSFCNTFW